ncbi:unnamed protein product [Didymodactylos carnosus]|uniref:Uncharacterized protein n=1 Tax=Didymodactylos carnosus TaxID=1234261 RepID=A0A814VMZ4_9BILA|nr:unnamed protein product [Didymodactylos carnosus]CAF3951831.1 unnamed protein product [Didymodactylos carnosus]
MYLDSQKRFNPTAYIRERNNKLREFELQKSIRGRVEPILAVKDVSIRHYEEVKSWIRRQRQRSDGSTNRQSFGSNRGSDSDFSDYSARGSLKGSKSTLITSLHLHDSDDGDDRSSRRTSASRKKTSHSNRNMKESIDSDFEPIPIINVIPKTTSLSVKHTNQEMSGGMDGGHEIVDIDERLKSLEKFIKENLPS